MNSGKKKYILPKLDDIIYNLTKTHNQNKKNTSMFNWPQRLKLINIIIALLIPLTSIGQKQSLSLETYKQWYQINKGALSEDGNFAFYFMTNKSIGKIVFVIKEVDGKYERRIENVTEPKFADNSKNIFGKLPNDTLFILNLGTKILTKISSVSRYDLLKFNDHEALVYTTKNKDLVLNIENKTTRDIIKNVNDYVISPSGTNLILKRKDASDGTDQLEWVNLKDGKSYPISKGENIGNIIFDGNGDQFAYYTQQDSTISIWVYDFRKNILKAVLNLESQQNKGELDQSNFKFSKDGKRIFYYLQFKENTIDSIQKENLDIWNYEDTYLISQFYSGFGRLSPIKVYPFVVNIATGEIKQLLTGNQRVALNTFNIQSDDYFIVEDSYGNLDEPFIKSSKVSYSLCETLTGKLTPIIPKSSNRTTEISISPNGKYIVYYNVEKTSYYTYNIRTGHTYKLTKDLNSDLIRYNMLEEVSPNLYPVGIIGWTKDDDNILIRGKFDIWMINQEENGKITNLTQHVGDNNGIVFNTVQPSISTPIDINDKMLFTSFNINNKEVGFYSIKNLKKPKLVKLNSGPYCISSPQNVYGSMAADEFICNSKNDAFLILKQSIDCPPNYYFSNDLIKFKPISNYNPQKQYNWLTSELHSYKDKEGNQYSGILYKPENFNDQKKYPVLLSYYERQSDILNSFPRIEPEMAGINIPYAVSNEYLVFLPDIHSNFGAAGEGALKSILAATNHLVTFSWIDSLNLGISGHSFGGFETNYIISHTEKFKAALTGAGNSDLVSMAYDIWGSGAQSKQFYYQMAAPKMKQSLSENPDIYVQNSPILNSNKIVTPLLILHNDADQAVPFRQGRQLFISLRSQNKPVWLLNYKGEGHGLGKEANRLNFATKVFEFFDYYLKGKEKPIWMIRHN